MKEVTDGSGLHFLHQSDDLRLNLARHLIHFKHPLHL